jgi:NAD+ kinase
MRLPAVRRSPRGQVIADIAGFLVEQGCEVALSERYRRVQRTAITRCWTWRGSARQCDLGLVVGGDGTMLGIGRQLAPTARR